MELGHKLTSRQKGFPQSEGIRWELSSLSDPNAGYPAVAEFHLVQLSSADQASRALHHLPTTMN